MGLIPGGLVTAVNNTSLVHTIHHPITYHPATMSRQCCVAVEHYEIDQYTMHSMVIS